MAFFNGTKKTKFLLVTILVMTLISSYALPMTVFADDVLQSDQIEKQDPPATPPADPPIIPPVDPPANPPADSPVNPPVDPPSGQLEPGGTQEPGTTPGGITGSGIEEADNPLDEVMPMNLMLVPLATVIPNTGDGISPAGPFDETGKDRYLGQNQYSVSKIGPQNDGTYTEKDGFSATVNFYGGGQGNGPTMVNWSSNYPVNYVVVKGQGQAHFNIYAYNSDNGDTGLMAPLDNQGNNSRINYIEFYYTTPPKEYDISLDKTASVSKATQGDEIKYTFVVTNEGTQKLSNVVIWDSLLMKFISVGELTGGESRTLEETFTVPDWWFLGDIVNYATVTGHYGAFNLKSVTDSDSATVRFESLPFHAIDLEKSVSPDTALPGDKVTYTFTITNTGLLPLKNIILTDPNLGAGWGKTYGSLAKGAQVVFTEDHILPANAAFPYVNTATVVGQKSWIPGQGAQPMSFGYVPTVSDTDSCSITKKVMETVNFFVRITGARPTAEGSQPTELFTGVLATLDIAQPAGDKPASGHSLLNEFSSAALKNDVENKAIELSSQTAYDALMTTIKANMTSTYSSYLPTSGDWHIDWYDFKWESDGWHIDGDIVKTGGPTDPPEETEYHYSVYYKVIESNLILHTISGATTAGSIFIAEPTGEIDHTKYRLYVANNPTGDVSFNFTEGEPPYEQTVWYEPIGEEQKEVGWYKVYYRATGSGIEVAPSVSDTTTASSITITPPALSDGYGDYQPIKVDYATLNTNGSVTISYSDYQIDGHIVTVWYDKKPSTPTPTTSTTSRGRGGSTVTVPEEPVPAAPIAPDAIDNGEQILLDDTIPAGPLPKTGGVPSLLLYGLGALLAGGGAALKLRNKKSH